MTRIVWRDNNKQWHRRFRLTTDAAWAFALKLKGDVIMVIDKKTTSFAKGGAI